MYIQSTLVISKSKGPSKTLRDTLFLTYQICSIEEKQLELPSFTNEYVIGLLKLEIYMENIVEKILWKWGEIAPQVEQFLLFSTIFCNLVLDLCVKTRTRFSLQDKQLFEITEAEITRVNCTFMQVFYKLRKMQALV